MDHRAVRLATYVLVIIGALNLGIMGVLDLNILATFLGGSPIVLKLIYILIGASAVYDIFMAKGYTGKRKGR